MNLPELNAIIRTKGHQGQVELFTLKNEIVPILNEPWIAEAWVYSDQHDGKSIETIDQEMKMYDAHGSLFQAMSSNLFRKKEILGNNILHEVTHNISHKLTHNTTHKVGWTRSLNKLRVVAEMRRSADPD